MNEEEPISQNTYKMIESELYGTLTNIHYPEGKNYCLCEIKSEEDGVVSGRFSKSLIEKTESLLNQSVRVTGDSIHCEDTHVMKLFMIEEIESFNKNGFKDLIQSLKEATGDYYANLSYEDLEKKIKEIRN